jgi:iron complex transport system substrate-binding protein
MRTLVFLLGCVATQLLYAGDEVSCDKAASDASRIAVAGGSVTEIIYFLGEQDRLVAVDRTSNFPSEARALPQIGYVRALSAEGLLSLKPTLVMGENDMGPPEVLAQLTDTGVDMVMVPEAHSPEGIMSKLRCVARVLALDDAQIKTAESKLASSLDKLGTISVTNDAPSAIVVLMFQEGSAVAAGGDTSGHGLLQMAGLKNALQDMQGWKPLSAESLITANPDFVIITDRAVNMAGGLEEVYANPGIRLTTAGRNNQLIQMDGMTLLGFGPRTLTAALELLELTTTD